MFQCISSPKFLPIFSHILFVIFFTSVFFFSGHTYRIFFFAKQKTFKFEFNAFAAFPDRGVLFLSPEKSNLLSELHNLHDANAEFSSMNKFYRTDLWEPHCSLASRLSPKQLEKSVKLFEDFKFPLEATCVSSNFVKYPKAEVLSSFPYLPE